MCCTVEVKSEFVPSKCGTKEKKEGAIVWSGNLMTTRISQLTYVLRGTQESHPEAESVCIYVFFVHILK